MKTSDRPVSASARRSVLFALILASGWSFLAAPAARACTNSGPRDITPDEQVFYDRLGEQLKAVFPAAPAGMSLSKAPTWKLMSLVCKDIKIGNVTLTAKAIYRYSMTAAERAAVETRQAELQSRYNALAKLPPDQQARYDALVVRYHEAVAEAKRYERAGNDAAAAPKYDEANAADRQGKDLELRHQASVRPQLEAIKLEQQRLPRPDVEFEATVQANGFFTSPRVIESVLTFGTEVHDRFQPLRVNGLRVKVEGGEMVYEYATGKPLFGRNQAQRDALLAAFDRSRLQALMQYPLPTGVAPAAWVVGAPPDDRGSMSPASAAGAPAAAPPKAAAPAVPAAAPAAAARSSAQTAQPPSPQEPETPSVTEAAEKAVDTVEKATDAAEKTTDKVEKTKDAARKLRGLLKF